MKTIHTKVECISFLVECEGGDQDGTMFAVFHRGNAKKMLQTTWSRAVISVDGVKLECTSAIFSVRNAILRKFVQDSHSKYQVCMVHDMMKTQIERQVNRVAIKALTDRQYTIKSRLVWKMYDEDVDPGRSLYNGIK